jgi:tripartite-type tricarboxylate transporter receptor subunit TctC
MRLIEPFGAGGGPDIVARALARPLSERLGRRVEVVNHLGGGSTAAPALVLDAPADGDTLLINTSAHAYSAVAARDLPYDPLNDFVAVAPLTTQAYVVVAAPQAAVGTLAELVMAADAAPGALRFASTGVGTGTHVGTEELNRTTGIHAMHVPAGPGDAITDVVAKVISGAIAYAMSPISIAQGPIAAGDVVALGVTTAQRSPVLPEVPTLAEAGAVGYDFPIWYGAWAAASTPPTIIDGLTSALAGAMADPGVRETLAAHGMHPLGMTRRQFRRFIADEARRAARIVSAPPR